MKLEGCMRQAHATSMLDGPYYALIVILYTLCFGPTASNGFGM